MFTRSQKHHQSDNTEVASSVAPTPAVTTPYQSQKLTKQQPSSQNTIPPFRFPPPDQFPADQPSNFSPPRLTPQSLHAQPTSQSSTATTPFSLTAEEIAVILAYRRQQQTPSTSSRSAHSDPGHPSHHIKAAAPPLDDDDDDVYSEDSYSDPDEIYPTFHKTEEDSSSYHRSIDADALPRQQHLFTEPMSQEPPSVTFLPSQLPFGFPPSQLPFGFRAQVTSHSAPSSTASPETEVIIKPFGRQTEIIKPFGRHDAVLQSAPLSPSPDMLATAVLQPAVASSVTTSDMGITSALQPSVTSSTTFPRRSFSIPPLTSIHQLSNTNPSQSSTKFQQTPQAADASNKSYPTISDIYPVPEEHFLQQPPPRSVVQYDHIEPFTGSQRQSTLTQSGRILSRQVALTPDSDSDSQSRHPTRSPPSSNSISDPQSSPSLPVIHELSSTHQSYPHHSFSSSSPSVPHQQLVPTSQLRPSSDRTAGSHVPSSPSVHPNHLSPSSISQPYRSPPLPQPQHSPTHATTSTSPIQHHLHPSISHQLIPTNRTIQSHNFRSTDTARLTPVNRQHQVADRHEVMRSKLQELVQQSPDKDFYVLLYHINKHLSLNYLGWHTAELAMAVRPSIITPHVVLFEALRQSNYSSFQGYFTPVTLQPYPLPILEPTVISQEHINTTTILSKTTLVANISTDIPLIDYILTEDPFNCLLHSRYLNDGSPMTLKHHLHRQFGELSLQSIDLQHFQHQQSFQCLSAYTPYLLEYARMAPDHALFPPSPFAELAVALFQQVARCNVDPIDRHLRAALTDVRARNSMLIAVAPPVLHGLFAKEYIAVGNTYLLTGTLMPLQPDPNDQSRSDYDLSLHRLNRRLRLSIPDITNNQCYVSTWGMANSHRHEVHLNHFRFTFGTDGTTISCINAAQPGEPLYVYYGEDYDWSSLYPQIALILVDLVNQVALTYIQLLMDAYYPNSTSVIQPHEWPEEVLSSFQHFAKLLQLTAALTPAQAAQYAGYMLGDLPLADPYNPEMIADFMLILICKTIHQGHYNDIWQHFQFVNMNLHPIHILHHILQLNLDALQVNLHNYSGISQCSSGSTDPAHLIGCCPGIQHKYPKVATISHLFHHLVFDHPHHPWTGIDGSLLHAFCQKVPYDLLGERQNTYTPPAIIDITNLIIPTPSPNVSSNLDSSSSFHASPIILSNQPSRPLSTRQRNPPERYQPDQPITFLSSHVAIGHRDSEDSSVSTLFQHPIPHPTHPYHPRHPTRFPPLPVVLSSTKSSDPIPAIEAIPVATSPVYQLQRHGRTNYDIHSFQPIHRQILLRANEAQRGLEIVQILLQDGNHLEVELYTVNNNSLYYAETLNSREFLPLALQPMAEPGLTVIIINFREVWRSDSGLPNPCSSAVLCTDSSHLVDPSSEVSLTGLELSNGSTSQTAVPTAQPVTILELHNPELSTTAPPDSAVHSHSVSPKRVRTYRESSKSKSKSKRQPSSRSAGDPPSSSDDSSSEFSDHTPVSSHSSSTGAGSRRRRYHSSSSRSRHRHSHRHSPRRSRRRPYSLKDCQAAAYNTDQDPFTLLRPFPLLVPLQYRLSIKKNIKAPTWTEVSGPAQWFSVGDSNSTITTQINYLLDSARDSYATPQDISLWLRQGLYLAPSSTRPLFLNWVRKQHPPDPNMQLKPGIAVADAVKTIRYLVLHYFSTMTDVALDRQQKELRLTTNDFSGIAVLWEEIEKLTSRMLEPRKFQSWNALEDIIADNVPYTDKDKNVDINHKENLQNHARLKLLWETSVTQFKTQFPLVNMKLGDSAHNRRQADEFVPPADILTELPYTFYCPHQRNDFFVSRLHQLSLTNQLINVRKSAWTFPAPIANRRTYANAVTTPQQFSPTPQQFSPTPQQFSPTPSALPTNQSATSSNPIITAAAVQYPPRLNPLMNQPVLPRKPPRVSSKLLHNYAMPPESRNLSFSRLLTLGSFHDGRYGLRKDCNYTEQDKCTMCGMTYHRVPHCAAISYERGIDDLPMNADVNPYMKVSVSGLARSKYYIKMIDNLRSNILSNASAAEIESLKKLVDKVIDEGFDPAYSAEQRRRIAQYNENSTVRTNSAQIVTNPTLPQQYSHSAVLDFSPEPYRGFNNGTCGSNDHLTFLQLQIRPLDHLHDASLLVLDQAFNSKTSLLPPVQTPSQYSNTTPSLSVTAQSDDGAGVGLISEALVKRISGSRYLLPQPVKLSGYDSQVSTFHHFTALVVTLTGTNSSGQSESKEFILKPIILPVVNGDLIIGADALSRFKVTRDRWSQTIHAFEKSDNQLNVPTASYSDVQAQLQTNTSVHSVLPLEALSEYSAVIQSFTFDQSTPFLFKIYPKNDPSNVICEIQRPHF